jgi:hypothetical protein
MLGVYMNDAWKWVVGIVVLYIIWRMLFVKQPVVTIPQIVTTGNSSGDVFSDTCGTISAGISEPCTEHAIIAHPPLHIIFPVAPTPAPVIAKIPLAPTGSNIISNNKTLSPGQSFKSPSGIYTAIFQTDGNFVVYKSGKALFATTNTTYNKGAVKAIMQSDGNFVIYNSANTPLFSTGTYGHPGAWMVMQDDGNLVIYDSDRKTPLWSSNTYQGSTANPNPVVTPPIVSATGIQWGTSPTSAPKSPIRPVMAWCGNGPGWCINKLDQLGNNPGCRNLGSGCGAF